MSPRTILLIHFAARVACLFVINTVYINIIGCLSLKISQHFLGSNKRVNATFIQLFLNQLTMHESLKVGTLPIPYTHIFEHTQPPWSYM